MTHSNIGLALGVSGTNILSPQTELFLATYPRYDQIGPIRLVVLFSLQSRTNQIVCFDHVLIIMGDTSLLTIRLVSLCLAISNTYMIRNIVLFIYVLHLELGYFKHLNFSPLFLTAVYTMRQI